MGHEEFQTKLFSMEIDNSKKAYVFYIDEKFAGLTVNHLRDKEINRLVGVDSFGNYTESILNIPTNENTTEKIKVDTDPRFLNDDNYKVVKGVVDEVIYTGFQSKLFIKPDGMQKIFYVYDQHRKFLTDEELFEWKEKVYFYWHYEDAYLVEVN